MRAWMLWFVSMFGLAGCPELLPVEGELEQEVECELQVLFGDTLYMFDFDYVNEWWIGDVDILSSVPPSDENVWQGMTFQVTLIALSEDGHSAFFEIKEAFSDVVVTCDDVVPEGFDQPPLLFDGERRN